MRQQVKLETPVAAAGEPVILFSLSTLKSLRKQLMLMANDADMTMAVPFPMVHGRLRCQTCGSKDIHARPNWRGLGQVAGQGPSRFAVLDVDGVCIAQSREAMYRLSFD